MYDKVFDNDPENPEPLAKWLQEVLDYIVKDLMILYNTKNVSLWLLEVDDDSKTVGAYYILN